MVSTQALDTTALLRTATVVRHRRHVGDRVDPDAQRGERAHRRLATRARALDLDVEVLDALLDRGAAGDLRDPLKPWPPDEAHDRALPWRSVIVMIVLLKDACTWQTPSATFLRTFLRTRCAAVLAGAFAMEILFPDYFLSA